MTLLDRLAALEPGQAVTVPTDDGVTALVLVSARREPRSYEDAHVKIEQFLLGAARRKAAGDKGR